MVNCAFCCHIGQCLACYRRHQKCINRVCSVRSLTLDFFITQYFLINKGISVTSDIYFKKLSCLFNDFGLKCLHRSTDMHKIDYTFFSLDFSLSFFPQSNLEEGRMHCTNLVWTLYKNIHVRGIFVSCFLKLKDKSKVWGDFWHDFC